MPEQALQVAFEIKTACDEISRRLLRWHWERKPGAHSLDALLEHIAAGPADNAPGQFVQLATDAVGHARRRRLVGVAVDDR